MHRPAFLVLVSFVLLHSSLQASPAEAQSVVKRYEAAMEKWSLQANAAATAEERQKVWSSRPDGAPFARELWTVIAGSLGEEWILEPAAWFIRVSAGLVAPGQAGGAPIFTKQNEMICEAVEKYHLASQKLIPLCAALSASSDPKSLAVLEKIQSSHKDEKIQGVAALAAAMRLRNLGDDGDIMKRRITYIRKAIIQSADVELEGASVAKLAEDELYIIRFLTKGRVAPDLVGVDSANRPLSLSAHQGKVIILIFWNSNVPDAKRLVEITNAMQTKFARKPLEIIGVNNDPLQKLRTLQADKLVPWTNFTDPENKLAKEYRVGIWPLVYVLDGERKIHYAGAPGSFVELTADALLAEIKTGTKK